MDATSLILTVILINLIGTISPGPSFIIVVQNALSSSRRSGIFTAIGIVAADLVHIIYCLLGIAVIISKSIIVFSIVKYLGALYLIYLGVKAMRAGSSIRIKKQNNLVKNSYESFKNGFFVTLLNPKATLLFLGIFTVTIPVDAPSFVSVVSGFGMLLSIALWYLFVAVFMTQKKVNEIFLRCESIFNKIFGGLLIALGMRVAFAEK